jgi:tetratricopeptide (TPR) repeat protein
VTQSKPPITGTTHILPFDKLSPRDFERLCLSLVEREGYQRAEHLGAAGSEQGRDIVAWREGALWAFQCKRVRNFGPRDALAQVEKVLALPRSERPVGLVFVVTCDISANTRQQVRERCGETMECSFWASSELDAMVKGHPEVVEEFFGTSEADAVGPTWWKRLRRHPLVFYSTVTFTVVAAIVGLLAGLIGMGADIGGARQQFLEWGLMRAFPAERENETLIVIASFYHSEGIPDTEIHNEICRAIQRAREDVGFSDLRVEVEPTRVHPDDRDTAEKLGKRYDASMIIWGADTGVRVTVNYLNLKHPHFKAAEAQISETERTQVADPPAYGDFVTEDLPGQLTFLSLFAIGQSYYIEGAYADSLEAIQKAVGSLVPGTEPPEGLAEAYFRLGWLHQVPMDDDEQAITDYDQAIALDPDDAVAYNNRGLARYDQGDPEGAIADYDRAMALNPDYAAAHNNRGVARRSLDDLEGAIVDYDRAIALDPDYAKTYHDRGIARYDQGDLEGAIADFDWAIALDPDYAKAYWGRGLAHRQLGNVEAALGDFRRYLELRPDADNREMFEGWIAELEVQLPGQ